MHSANGVVSTLHNEIAFGFGLPSEVERLLQLAASRVASHAESLDALNQARALAPDQIEVLVALYKFHCYRGDINLAEQYAEQTLVESARQGGFDSNWECLDAGSTNWDEPRGPARTYLYSLKAMAFIYLRQSRLEEAELVLSALRRLDPNDRVGSGVVGELAEALRESEDV